MPEGSRRLPAGHHTRPGRSVTGILPGDTGELPEPPERLPEVYERRPEGFPRGPVGKPQSSRRHSAGIPDGSCELGGIVERSKRAPSRRAKRALPEACKRPPEACRGLPEENRRDCGGRPQASRRAAGKGIRETPEGSPRGTGKFPEASQTENFRKGLSEGYWRAPGELLESSWRVSGGPQKGARKPGGLPRGSRR